MKLHHIEMLVGNSRTICLIGPFSHQYTEHMVVCVTCVVDEEWSDVMVRCLVKDEGDNDVAVKVIQQLLMDL